LILNLIFPFISMPGGSLQGILILSI